MVHQGSKFYNRPFKSWLVDNRIEMYLKYNEGKSAVAENFFRTLKNQDLWHIMLDNIVDKYNNTYHRTIKMKPINVKSCLHTEYSVDSNVKNVKLKIGNHVRISKYKNIFV